LTISAVQTGPLTVQLDASVTTAGGTGGPDTVTWAGNTYTLDNQVRLYGQMYDSPWDGGCTFWTVNPGPDWCTVEDQFWNNNTPLGSFAISWTAVVPTAMNYQTFVLAQAGLTWIDPAYTWFYRTQSTYVSVYSTIYVDATQPPTSTPDPTAGGNPVPTLSMPVLFLLGVILAGVGVLLIRRS
jgi:hypothetical protein